MEFSWSVYLIRYTKIKKKEGEKNEQNFVRFVVVIVDLLMSVMAIVVWLADSRFYRHFFSLLFFSSLFL